MNKTYSLTIEDSQDVYARTDGDIDVIAYVARRVISQDLDEKETYTVAFSETEGIGSDVDVRDVLRVTADGELISLLLKKRLTAERKANKPAETAGQDDETAEQDGAGDAQELVDSVLA